MRVPEKTFQCAANVVYQLETRCSTTAGLLGGLWISRKIYAYAIQKFPNHPNIVATISITGIFVTSDPQKLRKLGQISLIVFAVAIVAGLGKVLVHLAWRNAFPQEYARDNPNFSFIK
jgi:hypothetical protein